MPASRGVWRRSERGNRVLAQSPSANGNRARGSGLTAARRVASCAVRGSGAADLVRAVPEESPVAIVFNGGTYAVMMASPVDLEDFAVGFALSEGVVASAQELGPVEVVDHGRGHEVRAWLPANAAADLSARRRRIAGPTGCGLCGIDSLAEAVRPAAVSGATRRFTPAEIGAALQALAPAQTLNIETRAVHAAAFWTPEAGLVAVREDVGRHNALDKLVGALARAGRRAGDGLVLLTSRVSVEMVQKAATAGAGVVVAVSAPTALAIETAEAAGLTLVAIARADGFEIFTHPHRIMTEGLSDVA